MFNFGNKKNKKNNTDNQPAVCRFCVKPIKSNDWFHVYRFILSTDQRTHFIGIQKVLDELSVFAMDKGYHLSASQIIMLRPDLLRDFLAQKFSPEKIIYWTLSENEICEECFKKYKELVPEK